MVFSTLVPLQAVAFVLVALGAPLVVLTRDPLRQALVNGVYGITLVLLFVVLQAPDPALSMLVVSGIAYPLVILAAVARVRGERRRPEETKDE
ncbi:MAG TPA: hydrogenase subunit MbhD domain-containing protein [Gaiellaceae bacterium]|jgi:energy-converting hydrogenase B subunit D|nr:hydrogenase subunit MbhD domain-containing protein [Gaiellaceae bacterium]